MQVRYKLREARAAKRWSAEDLAIKSGVSRTTVYAVENGRNDTTVTNLCKMAHALGRRPEELFECEVSE